MLPEGDVVYFYSIYERYINEKIVEKGLIKKLQ